jgi:hypothetical protein
MKTKNFNPRHAISRHLELLHLLRSRLRGGILNKARRGELALRLPVGLVRLADGRCARDPDAGIQASIMAVFEAFAATGTVASTVRRLLACSIRFAQLVWGGEKAGTIIWCDYNRTRVLNVLTNPAYAGAYMPMDADAAVRRRMATSSAASSSRMRGPWSSQIASQATCRGPTSMLSKRSRAAMRKASVDPTPSARRAKGRRWCKAA